MLDIGGQLGQNSSFVFQYPFFDFQLDFKSTPKEPKNLFKNQLAHPKLAKCSKWSK
jgi:hypothetical protein